MTFVKNDHLDLGGPFEGAAIDGLAPGFGLPVLILFRLRLLGLRPVPSPVDGVPSAEGFVVHDAEVIDSLLIESPLPRWNHRLGADDERGDAEIAGKLDGHQGLPCAGVGRVQDGSVAAEDFHHTGHRFALDWVESLHASSVSFSMRREASAKAASRLIPIVSTLCVPSSRGRRKVSP